jgi:hypothetical protein
MRSLGVPKARMSDQLTEALGPGKGGKIFLLPT